MDDDADGEPQGLVRTNTAIYTGPSDSNISDSNIPDSNIPKPEPSLNRFKSFHETNPDSKDKRRFYQKGASGYIILIALYIVICVFNILYLFSVMSEKAVKIISTAAYAAAAFAYMIILYKHTKTSAERNLTRRGSVPDMFSQ